MSIHSLQLYSNQYERIFLLDDQCVYKDAHKKSRTVLAKGSLTALG
jgi:hypothetical protein